MNILVTGASGRIGANVVLKLVSEGHRVRSLVRPDSPRISKLARFDTEILPVDLADRAALEKSISGMDAILHAGAHLGGGVSEQFDVTLGSTFTLLEAARRHCPDLRRFVLISSTAVYEGTAYRPDPILEHEASYALSGLYAAAKISSEAFCIAYHRRYGMPVCSLRFPVTFVGRELLPAFEVETHLGALTACADLSASEAACKERLERLKAEGRRWVIPLNPEPPHLPWKRHWCDVRDAVEGCLLALTQDNAAGHSFNIMSQPLEYDRAVKHLAKISGESFGEAIFPEAYRYEFSLQLARERLGFKPQCTPEQMAEDAWRQARGEDIGVLAP